MNALAFYAGIGPDYHTNSEIAALLIKAGARVNVKDKEGKTALMYAAEGFLEEEAVKAVELLIKAGTDINAKDKQGNTALDYASCNVYEESNEKVIDLLRNAMNKN